MDLPTCPTCGQSVLDEDETDCPFCGAPLKGGSSKGKKPAKPIPKITPKNVPVVQTPAAAPAHPAKPGPKAPPAVTAKADEDDDPFAVDQSKLSAALPVQPRKTASKTYEVVCPMCETHGFVHPDAVGKLAKCCNPQCQLPVFEVPKPKIEAPPPPPPPKRPYGKWAMQGMVGLAFIGAIAFWWVNRNIVVQLPPLDLPPRVTPKESDPPVTKDKNDDVKPVVKQPAEWRRDAFALMIEIAREQTNTRKPTCRRLTATAAIADGKLDEALKEISQIRLVSEAASYEAIPPLTQLALKYRQSNSKPEFEKAVNEAVQLSARLPLQGRQPAQSAIALATVLALADRSPEGHKLLAVRQNGQPSDNVAAVTEIAIQDGSYDVDQILVGQAIGGWERPLSTAVTRLLILHGESKRALEWAEKDPDELAKTESVLLWATIAAKEDIQQKKPVRPQATEAVDRLSAAAKVCFQARLAELYTEQKQLPAANEALDLAEKTLATLKTPPTVRLQTVKELLRWEPPTNQAELQAAARAAAELAIVQSRLGKQPAAAKSLAFATAQLRALAPSEAGVTTIRDQLLSGGNAEARRKLREAFDLDNDDRAMQQLSNFGNRAATLMKLAQVRFQLQQKIVLAAIDNGALDAAAKEVEARISGAADADPAERELYLSTAIPQLLIERLTAAKARDQHVILVRLAGNQQLPAEVKGPLYRAQAEQLANQGKVDAAAKLLNPYLSDTDLLQLTALRIACRLARNNQVNNNQVKKSQEFLTALGDESLREDGLRLVSAKLTMLNGESELFEIAKQDVRQQAVACSILCGLIEGSVRRPAPAVTEATTPDTKSLEKKDAGKKGSKAGK